MTSALDKEAAQIALTHFETAQVMTDKMAALRVLTEIDGEEREQAMRQFHEDAKGGLHADKHLCLPSLTN